MTCQRIRLFQLQNDMKKKMNMAHQSAIFVLIMTSKRNMPDTFFYLDELLVQMPKGAYQKEKCQESGFFHTKWINIEKFLLGKYTKFVEKNCDLMT